MVDYVSLHKETWLRVADGESKQSVYEEIVKREKLYDYDTVNSCFLCDECNTICPACKGKWDEKGGFCGSDYSLYTRWLAETDSERKRELAIEIAHCAD